MEKLTKEIEDKKSEFYATQQPDQTNVEKHME